MPGKNYWKNRANQRMDDYILQSEQTADEIAKAYYKASKHVEKEMVKVIRGLSAISDTRTAVTVLKTKPNASLMSQLRKAVSLMPEGEEKQVALTMISSPAYLFRIRRLQATIDNARKECERLYKTELKDTTARLRALYDDAFTHTIYDIDKGYNTLHTFSMFPASRVTRLLKSQWSGRNYSERIWNSTQDLADVLKEQMLIAFMTGASVSKTSSAIREHFQSSAYAARRLVRTETNFIANQAELDAYKRLGIEEYQYIATLDTRTSKLCQRLDGRVFNIEDAEAGVNLPPMHPNCRSTTIMYDAETPIKERAARDENGKRITVPGDMTYKEWQEKYHPEFNSASYVQYRSTVRGDEQFSIIKDEVSVSYRSLTNSRYNLCISDKANLKPRAMHNIESRISKAYKILGIEKSKNKPKIIIIDSSETKLGVTGSYNWAKNVLYIVDKYGDGDVSQLQNGGACEDNPVSTMLHELLHWQDAERFREKNGDIDSPEKATMYFKELNTKCKEKLDSKLGKDYNYIEISPYADKMGSLNRYDEVYTEYRVKEKLKG